MRELLSSLRAYWTEAASYQRFLYRVGALLVLSAVFHAGVLVATGGSWEGDVSWRKPILFGESFGLTAIFLSWIMTFLPLGRAAGWTLALMLGAANTFEVAWVSFQQWREVKSHFNSSTAFDQRLFDLAGAAIGVAGIVIVVVTVWAFARLRAPASLAWAIRAGLILLVAGQVFGALMIAEDGHTFGAAGVMKVPHALSLHGLQVLPVLGWLVQFAPGSERRRVRIVQAGTGGYVLLVVVSAVQTFSGRSPLELGVASALLLGAGTVLVAAAYGSALGGRLTS